MPVEEEVYLLLPPRICRGAPCVFESGPGELHALAFPSHGPVQITSKGGLELLLMLEFTLPGVRFEGPPEETQQKAPADLPQDVTHDAPPGGRSGWLTNAEAAWRPPGSSALACTMIWTASAT